MSLHLEVYRVRPLTVSFRGCVNWSHSRKHSASTTRLLEGGGSTSVSARESLGGFFGLDQSMSCPSFGKRGTPRLSTAEEKGEQQLVLILCHPLGPSCPVVTVPGQLIRRGGLPDCSVRWTRDACILCMSRSKRRDEICAIKVPWGRR